MVREEIDVINVNTANGHSGNIINTIKEIKTMYSNMQLIGGNIATKEVTESLIDASVDAMKIRIGPRSICTTSHRCRCATIFYNSKCCKTCKARKIN